MSQDSDNMPIEGLMHMIVHSMTRQADNRLSDELGLSLAQLLILKHSTTSAQSDPSAISCNQQEMAQSLGVTSASISRHIKHLIDKGVIISEVNPANRREHHLTLTQSGHDLLFRGKDILDGMMKSLMRDIDTAEREQLRATLTKLYTTLST